MARESWLALDNEDHDKFAAAMVLCQNASGSCANVGCCAYGGDCFQTDISSYRSAARKIRAIAGEESGLLRSALLEAACHMDTMAKACRGHRS